MAEKTADSSLKTSRVDLDNKSSATNAVSSYANNLSQNNTTVKSDTSSTKYSMQENDNNTQELDNSSFNLKEKQNTSWQEHLEKNYKSIWTKTYAKDIVVENNSNLDYNKTEVSVMNLMDEELEEYLEYQKNRKKIWELKMKANKKVEEEENSKDLLTKQKKEKQRNIQKNNNQQ